MPTLLEYKCPCCGGAIGFDSETQKMKCPYCGTDFDVETLKAYDQNLKNDLTDDMKWEKMPGSEWESGEADGLRVYVCNSCGGQIVGDETTAAIKCPYCDNPVVVMGNFRGDLRPDYVIPFKLDKKSAVESLKKHLSGKRLLPKSFKDENHLDEIQGVYVPFWLFDTDAQAHITYNATNVRMWSDSKYDYTQTSFYMATRGGNISFERIPVDGSEKIADDLMESIEPFDFSEAVDFQTAYLAGYLANKYDVTSEQSIGRANERVKSSVLQAFSETVSQYDTAEVRSNATQLKNGAAHYALYPVWFLNTTWRGKKYTFAMNGQTGKFVGNLPVDKSAYMKYLFSLTGIIGAVCFGLSYLLWLL